MISALEDALRTEVSLLIKTTIEVALVEELESFRTLLKWSSAKTFRLFPSFVRYPVWESS